MGDQLFFSPAHEGQIKEIASYIVAAKKRQVTFQTDLLSILDSCASLIFRLDTQFRCLFINRRIETVTLIDRESFIGKTARQAGLSGAHCDAFEKACISALCNKETQALQFQVSGNLFQLHLYPELNDTGEVQTLLGVGQDITPHSRRLLDFAGAGNRWGEIPITSVLNHRVHAFLASTLRWLQRKR
jgi:PAS domain-containing protein